MQVAVAQGQAPRKTERPRSARSAAALLGVDSRRLAHSARAAQQVAEIAPLLPDPWQSVIQDAAWLHDIGYSEDVAETGLHALDGARWLNRHDWPNEVCQLVAWHTSAEHEAELRGLTSELEAEFERPHPLAAAGLTWADLTSSPSGDVWTPEQRLAEVLVRYPPDSVVHRATVSALPTLRAAVKEIEARLRTDTP